MPNPGMCDLKTSVILKKDDFDTNLLAQFKKDTNWTPSESPAIFSIGQQPTVRWSYGLKWCPNSVYKTAKVAQNGLIEPNTETMVNSI